MKLAIKITGPAGLGMNSTAEIIAGTFADLGYNVVGDNEYQSIIKGGLNYFDLFISDSGKALNKTSDIIIAFNAKNLEKTLPDLRKGGYIIINKKRIDKLPDTVDLSDYKVLSLEINDKYDNTYLVGLLFKILELDIEIVKSKIKGTFARKGEEVVNRNIEIVENIYNNNDLNEELEYKIEKIGESRKITYGNKALADGAHAGSLEYYSAYPMTPASSIIGEVIKYDDIVFLQGEDEIASINSALGASFTGKRAMVGTSGGGFALMTEALSFAVEAEFPIVAVLSQRAGPSTGTPTYHEQGDLNFALNPTFGDFDHIVMCPSTLEETYYFGGLSLNLADKYQSVVIFLMDKQSSEMHGTIGELKAAEVDRGKMLDNPGEDYKRYELTQDGISPRVKVGTKNGDFIATSYEHDEYGATTEESEMKVKMTEKRFKKLEDFYKKEGIKGYEVYIPHPNPLPRGEGTDPQKIIICHSFTSYTAKEFVKENPEYGLIIIKFFKPLDERLVNELIGKEEVIFVESNYSGQMENYIVKELSLHTIEGLKISHIRKYDLFPFYIEDFETLLNK